MNAGRRMLVGGAISAAILAAIVLRLDWGDTGAALLRADPNWIAVGMAALIANLVLRSARWATLLLPLGRFPILSVCFPVYAIGYAANILIPLRAGDLLRAYLFGRACKLSKASVLATIVLERIIDVLALLVMLAIVASAADAPVETAGLVYALGGFAVAGLLLARAAAGNHSLLARLGPHLARLPAGLRARIEKSLAAVLEALMTVQDGGAMIRVAAQSVALWACAWTVVGSFMLAFDMALPWYAPLLVIAVANLGLILPATPGNIGVAHVLYMSAVIWLGVDANLAFAFAILLHGIPHLMIVLIGLAAMWRSRLSLRLLGARDHEAAG